MIGGSGWCFGSVCFGSVLRKRLLRQRASAAGMWRSPAATPAQHTGLEVVPADVDAAELKVPAQRRHDALRAVEHALVEVDVVPYKTPHGAGLLRVVEPHKGVEVAEQVLWQVDHRRLLNLRRVRVDAVQLLREGLEVLA